MARASTEILDSGEPATIPPLPVEADLQGRTETPHRSNGVDPTTLSLDAPIHPHIHRSRPLF